MCLLVFVEEMITVAIALACVKERDISLFSAMEMVLIVSTGFTILVNMDISTRSKI